jgi:protein-tyrosine kinase
MEQIRKAVELAREAGPRVDDGTDRNWRRQRVDSSDSRVDARSGLRLQSRPDLREVLDDGQRADHSYPRLQEVTLNAAHLEAHRIISHDIADTRSKSFDMLRTQVLQTMDRQNWRFLAVTSPTAGCGKTLTAINLALSIARQRERSVLLVDMDLQKPQVGRCLGIKCGPGLLAAIDGSAALADAVVEARIRSARLAVLPIEKPVSNSSEWMASRAMGAVLEDIKKDFSSRVVIFDMPPMLYSDEVITILPQIDCVLLVAAVGTTTTSEIAQCNRHLESADVVRLVLNKVPGASNKYYY